MGVSIHVSFHSIQGISWDSEIACAGNDDVRIGEEHLTFRYIII
jgi:hypothetical protein